MTMSALEGRGVSAVKDWMVEQLPEGPTLYPKRLVSQHPERFFISEIVREHVFRRYSQEIPYSIQVSGAQLPVCAFACAALTKAAHRGHVNTSFASSSSTACSRLRRWAGRTAQEH